ncbi:hypothetical protein NSS82_19060 [Paenibacillus sp. FSL H7-0735]|uniref:hypothetical protein n=1 Tax=Paenibacillus sp. FSL H7-0735 TaxID=2954736 RepID=UPI0030F78A32
MLNGYPITIERITEESEMGDTMVQTITLNNCFIQNIQNNQNGSTLTIFSLTHELKDGDRVLYKGKWYPINNIEDAFHNGFGSYVGVLK